MTPSNKRKKDKPRRHRAPVNTAAVKTYETAVVMRTLGQEDGAEFLGACNMDGQRYYVDGQGWKTLTLAMEYWIRKHHQYSLIPVSVHGGTYALYNTTTGHWVCEVRKTRSGHYAAPPFSPGPYPTREALTERGPLIETFWNANNGDL